MIRITEEWHDPYRHFDDASRELVSRVIRLAIAGVPHRIVSLLDSVGGLQEALVTEQQAQLAATTDLAAGTFERLDRIVARLESLDFSVRGLAVPSYGGGYSSGPQI